MKKRLQAGIHDFKEIIADNYYYVDKTKFIEQVFTDGMKVKLFTRPRRFGKTLNMSMLNYFFNVENAEENRKLFEGLYIENSPVFEEQGKYPVIFISMKDSVGATMDIAIERLRESLHFLYGQFYFIRESLNDVEKKIFDNAYDIESSKDTGRALLNLSIFLERHYHKKVMVFIDEYDAPLLSAYKNGYYNEAVTFFSTFYSSILKNDNGTLEKAVLTGITKIGQAGIFSGLNNIENYTILSKRYDEYFGLLESEVIEALDYYELKDSLEEVKAWYDGYKFGDTNVYNPLSILKYMYFRELKPYWLNTSEDFKLREYLETMGYDVVKDLETLIKGESIFVTLSEQNTLGKNGKLTDREFWQLMLFAGYLTITKTSETNRYELIIPNEEVKSFFKDKFVEIIFDDVKRVDAIATALSTRNLPELINKLEEALLQLPSYFDTAANNENAYHMLLLGLSWGMTDYIAHSNLESGHGRADIILQARNPKDPSYILEFKIKDDSTKALSLEEKAKSALAQIEEKEYATFLLKEGVPREQIVQIGLAFEGKNMAASYKE